MLNHLTEGTIGSLHLTGNRLDHGIRQLKLDSPWQSRRIHLRPTPAIDIDRKDLTHNEEKRTTEIHIQETQSPTKNTKQDKTRTNAISAYLAHQPRLVV